MQASQSKEQFLNDRSTPYHYRSIYNVRDKKDLYRYCFGEFLLTCILVMVFLRLFPLRTPSVPVTKEEIRDYQKRKYIHAIFVGLTICALTGAMLVFQSPSKLGFPFTWGLLVLPLYFM